MNFYKGSKETAFIHAISAAAAMYEVTKACTKGDIKHCSCNQKLDQLNSAKNSKYFGSSSNSNNKLGGQYEWSGCSDNVLFGHRLSKQFVDSKEYADSLNRPIRLSSSSVPKSKLENIYLNKEYKLMNLHNNEVGRRTILKNMKQICKCHGVSGSCSVKVCWKVMPDFRVIGDELYKRYSLAAQIKDNKPRMRVQKLKMILSRRSVGETVQNREAEYKDELVFIDRSTNFCRADSKLDTLGTKGRICSLISSNKNETFIQKITQQIEITQTCNHLCCGRGYYSKVIETEEDCYCKFQWCCTVKCEKCKKRVVQYFCN